MALAEPLRGDPHEAPALPQIRDVGAPGVAHPSAQAAHELEEDRRQRPSVGHATLDPLGDELLVGRAALPVAILRALAHRPYRAHASINLVAPALVEHEVAGRLV